MEDTEGEGCGPESGEDEEAPNGEREGSEEQKAPDDKREGSEDGAQEASGGSDFRLREASRENEKSQAGCTQDREGKTLPVRREESRLTRTRPTQGQIPATTDYW